jgi:hypothetical protein
MCDRAWEKPFGKLTQLSILEVLREVFAWEKPFESRKKSRPDQQIRRSREGIEGGRAAFEEFPASWG